MLAVVVLLVCTQLGSADLHDAIDDAPAGATQGVSLLTLSQRISIASNSSCTKKLTPTILYMGWGHSGSTTLAKVLNDHPSLSWGLRKEHDFFCRTSSHATNQERTWQGYMNEFEVPCDVKRTLDASPYYHEMALSDDHLCLPQFRGPEGLMRLRGTLPPNVQLIFMVRDPLDWMQSRLGLRSMCNMGLRRVVEHACYADQIEPFFEVFPKENIIVLDSKEMFEDPRPLFDKLFHFLKVDPLPATYYDSMYKAVGRRRHSSKVKPIDYRMFHQIKTVKRCHQRLQELAGHDFLWIGTGKEEVSLNVTEAGAALKLSCAALAALEEMSS